MLICCIVYNNIKRMHIWASTTAPHFKNSLLNWVTYKLANQSVAGEPNCELLMVSETMV